jgi:dipeptidase
MRQLSSAYHSSGRIFRLLFAIALALSLSFGFRFVPAQAKDVPDGCTTIAVGRLASADGSVLTSHTCDGHDGRTWMHVVPRQKHAPGSMNRIYLKTDLMASYGDTTGLVYTGSIPQVPETYAYIYSIYPCINEHQLAIGESTFDGKEVMRSDKGMFNLYELTRLMAERCRTAREAIALADELLTKYGYNDAGECLTIADTKEVWMFEVVGPGQGKIGAVWAARRVPDDEISVNGNSARIRRIDLKDKDYFLASKNVFSTAIEMGFWDPKSGEPFEFCYAYGDRNSMWARRREWRVFDLLAPSLKLDANQENYPFSIKPEKKVSVEEVMKIFEDTYEGTEYDMTKFMLVKNEDGKCVKSPYANPFMNYDQMPLWKINGALGELGERTIARYYCIYFFVTQSRDWLPDPIGGVAWFAWDNPAMTCHAPLYCGIADVPGSWKFGGPKGRPGYSEESAWWAFNRASVIAAHRWGEMRNDVYAVRDPFRRQAFDEQKRIEDEALKLYGEDPRKGIDFLTKYSFDFCGRITEAYWKLGDDLFTKYDERW